MKVSTLVHDRILAGPHGFRQVPPVDRDQLRAENTLFGWVLRAGREQIPCGNEAEAKLLAALASLGFTEIPVPNDPTVLRDIVEPVEKAVAILWERVEEAVSSELNPNRRRELLDLVWEEIRDKIGIPTAKKPESAIQ